MSDKKEVYFREEELGALWVKESLRGQMYFSGKFHLMGGDLQIVVLPIENPTNDPRIPQFRIVKSMYVKGSNGKASGEGRTLSPTQ